MENVEILGNKVTLIEPLELNNEIKRIVSHKQKQLILNTNIYGINLANQQEWLREFRNSSHIVFCDGEGVIMGAKILGIKIPQRIPLTEWLWDLCSFCEKNKLSIFFLGTTQEILNRAKTNILRVYPNLLIKGIHHGFFNKEGKENDEVVELINKNKPDILVVSFGMPLQEKWLNENWKKLDARVFLVGGACFDYASGCLKRGPKILTDNGFEWFCRLIIEPKRLWRRYLIGNLIFFYNILKTFVRARFISFLNI